MPARLRFPKDRHDSPAAGMSVPNLNGLIDVDLQPCEELRVKRTGQAGISWHPIPIPFLFRTLLPAAVQAIDVGCNVSWSILDYLQPRNTSMELAVPW